MNRHNTLALITLLAFSIPVSAASAAAQQAEAARKSAATTTLWSQCCYSTNVSAAPQATSLANDDNVYRLDNITNHSPAQTFHDAPQSWPALPQPTLAPTVAIPTNTFIPLNTHMQMPAAPAATTAIAPAPAAHAPSDSDSDDEAHVYNERAQFQGLKIRSDTDIFKKQIAYFRQHKRLYKPGEGYTNLQQQARDNTIGAKIRHAMQKKAAQATVENAQSAAFLQCIATNQEETNRSFYDYCSGRMHIVAAALQSNQTAQATATAAQS
jgi:hypothetical protein